MSLSFVNATTTSVISTTASVTYPTSITAKNVLLLTIGNNTTVSGITISDPAFTLIDSWVDSTNGCTLSSYSKIATGSETGTFTVSWTGTSANVDISLSNLADSNAYGALAALPVRWQGVVGNPTDAVFTSLTDVAAGDAVFGASFQSGSAGFGAIAFQGTGITFGGTSFALTSSRSRHCMAVCSANTGTSPAEETFALSAGSAGGFLDILAVRLRTVPSSSVDPNGNMGFFGT